MKKGTTDPNSIEGFCRELAPKLHTSVSNISWLIHCAKWPRTVDAFVARWNERARAKAQHRSEKKKRRAKYLREQWAKLTPDEKLKKSQRRRELEKARGWKWKGLRDYKHTPKQILAGRLRARFRNHFGGTYWGTTRAREFIGCEMSFLRAYIEARFKPGMTWENKGEWEIDHIEPVATFDLTKRKNVERCFHFTNLRPEWKMRNKRRGCKPDEVQLEIAI